VYIRADENDNAMEEPQFLTYQSASFDEPNKRNKESKLKEQEATLAQREFIVRQQEQELRQYGRLPNWPRCRPLLYHSIEDDVAEDHQKLVKSAYYYWIASVSTLGFNVVTTFAILISGAQNVTTGGTDFGMGVVYFFLISPLSFILWYQPLYRGFSSTSTSFVSDKSVYLLVFFVFFTCHLLFQLYMGMGIPGKGGGGLINMIAMFAAGKHLAGALLVVSTVLWLTSVLFCIVLLQIVASRFRQEGYSLENARQNARWGIFSGLFSQLA
jgi:hypothetical protein